MKELNHQTGETLEGTRDTNGRVDFDEDALGGLDVYLEVAGFVDGRIEEG